MSEKSAKAQEAGSVGSEVEGVVEDTLERYLSRSGRRPLERHIGRFDDRGGQGADLQAQLLHRLGREQGADSERAARQLNLAQHLGRGRVRGASARLIE